MKIFGCHYALLLSALVLVSMVGCGQETPAGKSGASGKQATESTGQAIVDSIKIPLDKSRQVEGTLEKAADKTADTLKETTQ